MTPCTIRLVGRIAFVWRPCDHLVVVDMAQQAVRVHRHIRPTVLLVVWADMHIRLDRGPYGRSVALLTRLRRNEMGGRRRSRKTGLVAIRAATRHTGMRERGRQPCRRSVACVTLEGSSRPTCSRCRVVCVRSSSCRSIVAGIAAPHDNAGMRINRRCPRRGVMAVTALRDPGGRIGERQVIGLRHVPVIVRGSKAMAGSARGSSDRSHRVVHCDRQPGSTDTGVTCATIGSSCRGHRTEAVTCWPTGSWCYTQCQFMASRRYAT